MKLSTGGRDTSMFLLGALERPLFLNWRGYFGPMPRTQLWRSIALKAVSVACVLLLQQPHLKSKSRVNTTHLTRRLKLWKDGKIDELLFEGRSIQQRLHIANRSHTAKRSPDKDSCLACSFAKLMIQGKTKDAICLITENNRGRILLPDDVLSPGTPDSPTVLEALKSKHPPAQPRVDDAVSSLGSDPPAVHPIIYEGIDAHLIRRAALHTTGAGGPLGTDAHCWRRLCSAFKRSSDDLWHSLSLLARKLCSVYVDPNGLSPFLACRLVALDKNPGIRPIGVCETVRRIIAKAVLSVTRHDVLEATGSIQLCVGQPAGVEAAIHAVGSCFELGRFV